MSKCRRRLATNDGRSFLNKIVIFQGLNHKKCEIYSACQVTFQYRITDMFTPYRQALTFTFFKVTASYHRPLFITAKYSFTCLHLVV